MSNPSFEQRTAVEFGEELQIPDAYDSSNNAGTLRSPRTSNFTQIPIYNANNPFTLDISMLALDRAKPYLDPDGFATGDASHGVAGQVYAFGSGIANLPPDWFRILKACGMVEVRIATKANQAAGSIAVAKADTGGYLSAGVYYWKWTTLMKSDGTTPATTLAEACFESRLSAALTATTTTAVSSANFTDIPASGIKRIYRTIVGGGRYFYVGQVEDQAQTYTDTLADVNLGIEGPLSSALTDDSIAATELATGSLLSGVYKYKYTLLLDEHGAVVTDSAVAVWESASCTEASVETVAGKAVTVTGLPSSGVKRVYRTIDDGSAFYFLEEVASGTTSIASDDTTDVALVTHEPLHECYDCAIYAPTSAYDDMWSMTINTYLDGRKKQAIHCRGNMTWGGDAGQNVPVPFELRGIYQAGSKTANPASIAAPAAPSQFCAASVSFGRKSGGVVSTTDGLTVWPFSPKVRNFGGNLGRTPAQRADANASCSNSGVLEFMIGTEPDPHFTFTIEDNENYDFDAYAKTPDTWSVRATIGNTAYKRVYFSNDLPWGERQYTAQLSAAPTYPGAAGDGIRLQALDFKMCGVSNSYMRIIHW